MDELVHDIPRSHKETSGGVEEFGPSGVGNEDSHDDFFSEYTEYMRSKGQKRHRAKSPQEDLTDPSPPNLNNTEGGLNHDTFTTDLGLGEGIMVREAKHNPAP